MRAVDEADFEIGSELYGIAERQPAGEQVTGQLGPILVYTRRQESIHLDQPFQIHGIFCEHRFTADITAAKTANR